MARRKLPLPLEDRLNPGRPYLSLANEYLRSADHLRETLPSHAGLPGYPLRLLYAHASELYLKAFLVTAGYSVDDLARDPYKHDLVALLNEANDCGLGCEAARLTMQHMQAGHYDLQFRYNQYGLILVGVEWLSEGIHFIARTVCKELHDVKQNADEEVRAQGKVLIDVPTRITLSVDDGRLIGPQSPKRKETKTKRSP